MQVGSFGTIVFSCSDKEVMTFKDLSRTRTAEFAEHPVLEKKSRLQFTGVSLEEISFSVLLMAGLTDPEDRAIGFWTAQESGEPRNLILGGRNYGKFVVTNITEGHKHNGPDGKPLCIELELSLKEYN
ncbi:phage tail protein [Maridesulfovibrio ferrireducens]|uniref:phage tail protein n=1 Tax=Maridesulfovibrio ferrireducens TaxID=246191 RepID=UPI001A23D4FA|nr:phage tail protein [Maridesulfovibrio ferrireducens]MBI9112242.1 phage tail protein [Maridesulfovibrio ferrireducens]